MTTIPPITHRVVILSDADLSEFHTLPEFLHRVPGKKWYVDYLTLPTHSLYCRYQNPGDAHAPPGGFMAGVGWPLDQTLGKRIVDLAAAITAAVQSGTADRSNIALDRILQFHAGGVSFILSRPQLLAFVQINGFWCVCEGVHRTVALAMLSVPQVEGVNFSTVRQ